MHSSIEPKSPSKLYQTLSAHPLFSFFILAYAISWILTIPFILSEWHLIKGNMQVFFVIKSFGPFIAALIMIGITEGKEGVKLFRRKIRQIKAGWQWYLIALLGIPLLIMLGIFVQPGRTTGFLGVQPSLLVTYLISFVLVFFGGGPLGEEPGWRGYALPRLQSRFKPFWATLILGVLWTCWHLPDFLTSAQGGGPGTGFSTFLKNFPIFLLLVLSLAFLLTWIFNRTGGSIFMALLAHTSVNTPQVALVPLFPAVDTTSLNLAALIAFGVAALLIILLTRGQLGYKAKTE